jgi:uncharacterized protein (DUF1499 family)
MLFGMRPAWFTQNDVTTGESAAYPELQPRAFPGADPDHVYQALRTAAASVPRWRVVREDPAARELHVEVTTAFFNFVDDLTARVESGADGPRVLIRSHSRVGRGDLGENARHIAALLQRLDAARI